ncbi:hypothetical protein TrVE_jg11699 [Triparma verrucosa]|uniref:Uncharacterized protein n=1 Tax=Triparma verrucosa TaxID=1606542 RepID=A0A9W7BK33_9STRA|nr:hypothetical protein TrVE_jg11699 [Triparma verrucosa]
MSKTLDAAWSTGGFSGLPQSRGPTRGTTGDRRSSQGGMRVSSSQKSLSQARKINGSALLSPKFKSTGFSNNLEGRFYENNGMEASKIKKKLKKLDQAKRQKKLNEMERKREQKRIELIEARLKAKEDARRAKEEEEQRIVDSAHALQGLYKCRKARMRVNLMRREASEMDKLALFFQSSYRGMLGRKAYAATLKGRNDKLVSKIQAILRGRYNYKKIAEQELFMIVRKNYLATMVQRRWRGIFGRTRFNRLLERRRHLSASRMQALYRGVRGKKLFSMRQAVVREQNEMKRLKALEEARIHKAVSMIQSVVRRNLANTVMKVLREERRQKCVLIMQSVMRGKLGREKAARRRELLEEEERELEEARLEMEREEREEARKLELERQRVEAAERRKREKEEEDRRRKEMERERLRKLVEEEERKEEEEGRKERREKEGVGDENADFVIDQDFEDGEGTGAEGLDDLNEGGAFDDNDGEGLNDLGGDEDQITNNDDENDVVSSSSSEPVRRQSFLDRMGGADDRVYDVDYFLDNGEDVDDVDHEYETKYVATGPNADETDEDGFEDGGEENLEDLGGKEDNFDDDFDDGEERVDDLKAEGESFGDDFDGGGEDENDLLE